MRNYPSEIITSFLLAGRSQEDEDASVFSLFLTFEKREKERKLTRSRVIYISGNRLHGGLTVEQIPAQLQQSPSKVFVIEINRGSVSQPFVDPLFLSLII